ncbi:MAG: RsmD family RNA methyltransferase [Cytophagales bacterium]|nr:RsmD family RNA methyltransferase [Cytophagales bacterium]
MAIAELLKTEVQQYIEDHENHDPFSLSLKAKQLPKDFPVKEAIAQIQARQKARKKLPEWHAQKGILFPPALSMEQCSSELTAKYKSTLVKGKKLIDITGGTGIDTFYLSRSFEQTAYVEQQAHLCELARHNFSILEAPIECIEADGVEFVLDSGENYDCIYLDPARRSESLQRVHFLEDCTPNIVAIKNELLQKAKKVLVKTAPMMDIRQAVHDLGCVEHIWVVSLENECKEVLYLLGKNPKEDPEITAVNLRKNGNAQLFVTSKDKEQIATSEFSKPLNYLCEPNASVLKAGAYKHVGEAFGLKKLHTNSHLYTSEKLPEGFPGKVFRILGTCPYDRKKISKILPEKKASVAVRNFPDAPDKIRKKLKLKDGGNCQLFATTDFEGLRVLVVAKRI